METALYDPKLIEPSLWETARWTGMGYLFDQEERVPPHVGPIFQDATAGRRIFESWRDRLGGDDRYEALRLVLVSGPPECTHHAVLLSTDSEGVALLAAEQGVEGVQYVLTHMRVCHLGGPPSALFQRLQAHARTGRPYFLTPFVHREKHGLAPLLPLAIGKRRIELREAHEIPRNDPDAVVFV